MTVAPRRSLLVVLGLALAAAVFPAASAQAEDQPPADQAQLAVPTEHPGPVGPAQPPTGGNGDLANPTVDPDPDPEPEPEPQPDPDPDPSDGGGHPSIPTPQRVDTGLGGTAGPSGQPAPAAAVVSLALALLVVLVVLALPASARRAPSRSAR
jgi:outer membrane biosynthesis protein TonB